MHIFQWKLQHSCGICSTRSFINHQRPLKLLDGQFSKAVFKWHLIRVKSMSGIRWPMLQTHYYQILKLFTSNCRKRIMPLLVVGLHYIFNLNTLNECYSENCQLSYTFWKQGPVIKDIVYDSNPLNILCLMEITSKIF